jgi:methionyl-tRNA synthetase
MSKTLGNIVEPLDTARKYGADALRYYLAREVVFGKDGDFSWEQFIQRYNSELANDLGNIVSRSLGMVKQYFGGRIPPPGERAGVSDPALREVCESTARSYRPAMDRYEIHSGIAAVFGVVRAANRFIEDRAPWSLMKKEGGKAEAATVLFTVCEVLRQTAVMLSPFMPAKSQGIWAALGIDAHIDQTTFREALEWRDDWEGMSPGVGDFRALFPRIEPREEEPTGAGESEEDHLIDIDEFRRLDLRIGRVKSASMVPGADKLMKIFVDIGDEERQVVAGIARHYSPEDLTGKSVVLVANLKPARIRGVESRGMILAATDGDRVIALVPDKDAAPGSRIS